jgi:hypothetical protein
MSAPGDSRKPPPDPEGCFLGCAFLLAVITWGALVFKQFVQLFW